MKSFPCPKELKGLIGGKIKEPLVTANWPDILRSAATMVAGVMPPSQLLRKFAAYPRQHELALALREIGRVERTLFIIDWLLDADMRKRRSRPIDFALARCRGGMKRMTVGSSSGTTRRGPYASQPCWA